MLSILLYTVAIFSLVWWIEKSSWMPANHLINRSNPALEMENWLKNFSWGKPSELQSTGTLPKYKFYTEILDIILNMARKMGGSYQESILFLRQGLQSDRQFEKKLKESLMGLWLQILLMMLLTWGFIFAALTMVGTSIAHAKLLLILCWQLCGMLSLPWMIRFFRTRFFGDIGKLWKMLYVLQCLVKVPLSRSEVMVLAGIPDLKLIHQTNLLPLIEKLRNTCHRTLHQGGSYETEVHSLMEELRFQEKWHYELFEKRMMVIKLGILAIFFLPSYLAFIFLLIEDFMHQM